MAISANTPDKLQIGVGDIYWNDVDLGATGLETTFAVEQEVYWPELGGALGPIAGTSKVITESATLQATLKEMDLTTMTYCIPELAESSDANSEYTTTPNVTYIAASDHKTVKWKSSLMSAKEIQIWLLNALPEGGMSATFNDRAEFETQITWRSYKTASAPRQRAWQIYIEI